jgi:hypothetical protein
VNDTEKIRDITYRIAGDEVDGVAVVFEVACQQRVCFGREVRGLRSSQKRREAVDDAGRLSGAQASVRGLRNAEAGAGAAVTGRSAARGSICRHSRSRHWAEKCRAIGLAGCEWLRCVGARHGSGPCISINAA